MSQRLPIWALTITLVLPVAAGGDQSPGRLIPAGTEPRHFRHVNDDFYNSLFVDLAGGNDVDRALSLGDFATAEKRVRRLAEMGATGALYNGRHMRLNYPDEWDRIADITRMVAGICHDHGIKVIEHHDVSIFLYRGYPQMLRNLDWLQRDIRTGEVTRWACPNNDDYISFYRDYLREFQSRTNVDGYMLDELNITGIHNCGCRFCREKFHQATGVRLPTWVSAGGDAESPLYRNWQRWVARVSERSYGRLLEAVREVRPDVASMVYSSSYSDPSRTANFDLTLRPALHCSFVGWENMIEKCLNGWRPFMRGLKFRLSMANYYGIPAWSLNYSVSTKESTYFGWALCQLGKHSVWMSGRSIQTPEEVAYLKRYSLWPDAMPHQHARCLTDTALLLSNQTRSANTNKAFYWADAAGWGDVLIEGNQQFDALLDGDLELPDRLGKYGVLLLPSQACLSADQCEHLAEWVHAGGTAIITAHTSLYDEFGQPRDDFRLRDMAGISYVGETEADVRVTGRLGDRPIALTARKGRLVRVSVLDATRSRVIAVGEIPGEAACPAVIETSHGKGRFIYAAMKLGDDNWEGEEEFRGFPYAARSDPGAADAILALVDYAHRSPAPAALRLPKGVIGVAYQLHGGQEDGTVFVQILNVGGKNAKRGERYTGHPPEEIVLPAVDEPMVIRLAGEVTGPITVQGPELTEDVSVVPRAGTDGVVEISVPGDLLRAYLQVRIPAKPFAGQMVQPVPLAESIRDGVE